jgi:hypothetical protein
MYVKQLAQHLGDEISVSKHVTQSPLYEAGDQRGDPPKVDRTKDNLVLQVGSWPSLLPHLKWALGCKGLDFRFKILNDLDVVNVKVGATSRSAKGVARAVEGDGVYNCLEELVQDYSLVILKVGYLGYKNRAAAGALLEFLLIQESQRKPLWLVVDSEHEWNHSYSPEVEAHLSRCFDEIDMPSADPGEKVVRRTDSHIVVDDGDEEEENYFSESRPVPKSAPKRTMNPSPVLDMSEIDESAILPGLNSPPKKKWRS